MPCKTFFSLDRLLGMHYLSLCLPPSHRAYCVSRPRSRSFIVVEEPILDVRDNGAYLVIALFKRGYTTEKAIRLMARFLRAPASKIGYAGIKDADASTLQYVTVPLDAADEQALRALISRRALRIRKGLVVAVRGRSTQGLSPGMLQGNLFTVVLEPQGHKLLEPLKLLQGSKLVAYYGYQRFGTKRPNTHVVAYYVLKGSSGLGLWEAIRSTYPDESVSSLAWRLGLGGKLKAPSGLAYEEKLLECIEREGVFSDCLSTMSFFSRRLLLSAIRSWLFNEYLSARIGEGISLENKLSGEKIDSRGRPLAPVPGDIELLEGEAKRLFKKLLGEYNIDYRVLRTTRLYWRPVYTVVENLKVSMLDNKRIVLKFRLEQGMYGSLVLREIVPSIDCL
ncbi:MAG: tRNA pseudouridine(13) synthase TruD [Pyrodictiaceae archaeon]